MRGFSFAIAMLNGAAALLLLAFSGQGGESDDNQTDSDSPPASISPPFEPAVNSPAKPDNPRAALEPAQAPAGESEAEVIDDIQDIRRKLGIDPLAGTSLERLPGEPSGDKAFLETLRSVIPAEGTRENSESINDGAPTFGATQLPFPNTIEVAGSNRIEPAPAESRFVASLQTAAEQLGRRADELERRQEYEHADRLRRLANRLRREARFGR